MKFLLTGITGQVGFELRRSLAPLGEVVAMDRSQCDLANPDSLRAAVRGVCPDVIVNPAAYTAVDKAESDEATAYAINSVAPGILGEEANRLGALVIHYSTDYVYDGTKPSPYLESDATNPLSFYGRSKLDGEQALGASGARHWIFRTSWVYGIHGANFIKTILRLARGKESLGIVADQFGAPTGAAFIADVTAQALAFYSRKSTGQDFQSGVYHLAPSGSTNWNEYACRIVRSAIARGCDFKLSPENIRPISTAEYPLPATRPANSLLDTSKLKTAFGIHCPPWERGVDAALQIILA